MRTTLYIDGFNFYYGGCRRFGLRWVNPLSVAQLLLRQHDIVLVRYFSAPITAGMFGAEKSTRQAIYLRALRTIPNLEIEMGTFLQNVKKMPRYPVSTPPEMVEVLRNEEKGTDVNIATAMLLDAFDDCMECAVLISNDSDLIAPIRILRQRFGKTVGLINPQKQVSVSLAHEVDFMRQIRRGVTEASLFPDTLSDAEGTFSKPDTW